MVKADLAEVLAQLSGGSVPKDSTAFAAQFCAAYRQGAEQHNLPTLVHNSGREVEESSDATRCHLRCRYSGLQLTHPSFYTRSCTPSTLEGALTYLGKWIFTWVRQHDNAIPNRAHKVPIAPGLGALAEAAAAAAVPPQQQLPTPPPLQTMPPPLPLPGAPLPGAPQLQSALQALEGRLAARLAASRGPIGR